MDGYWSLIGLLYSGIFGVWFCFGLGCWIYFRATYSDYQYQSAAAKVTLMSFVWPFVVIWVVFDQARLLIEDARRTF